MTAGQRGINHQRVVMDEGLCSSTSGKIVVPGQLSKQTDDIHWEANHSRQLKARASVSWDREIKDTFAAPMPAGVAAVLYHARRRWSPFYTGLSALPP